MKHAFLLATCTASFAVQSGCGQATPSTDPPSSSDYVKNSDGRGMAKVWSITFDVVEPVGDSSGIQLEGSPGSDPDKTDARTEITIGDVQIRLERTPGGPITFEFNGEQYGTLEIGDKVTFDKNRNVKVNNEIRQPEEVKPQSE